MKEKRCIIKYKDIHDKCKFFKEDGYACKCEDECPFVVSIDMDFVTTLLRGIERELSRLYWNKYQQELSGNSPFENNGPSAVYENDTFRAMAYDWNEENDGDPNFEYKGFRLWWYKYLGRGMYAISLEKADPEFLYQMYKDCILSLRKDFGEDNG